ncbi:Nn.00g104460.m01.CDS01 [Neocucurbitaria sp. VM-36]
MPHKHRRIEEDETQFDLPPTVRAAPLPVGKARTFNTAPKGKKRKINHVEGYGADDTPKAFQRLMAFSKGGVKKRSGLDDGNVRTKKQKKADQKAIGDAEQENMGKSEEQAQPKAVLKIQPGESMAEFRARVDQALPLSGVSKSGKKVAGVSDHRVTKHERRLKRLQKGWREEEARIREKEMEEKELAEEEQDELDAMWEDKTSDLPSTTTNGKKSKKKKNKRKLFVGEIKDNNSEDEWEALKRKREQRKGLHDVVSAPPTFDKVPREIFKVKNGAGAKVGNVPNAAGSLRKREELGEERKTIIDTYRELMAAKKKT